MAVRSVDSTDTLETLRTTFNSHATDTGDLAALTTSSKTSLVAAINEAAGGTNNFVIRDSTSTTQTISGGDILNIVGDSNISATVSATDQFNIALSTTITGISSITATTITEGSDRVATRPFAIAQAIALG
jgi:hypothetical protein|tara:strand:- start:85 stop:477 length:393 start_codon:yes stop_codon:yes gene_type:complete